MKKCDLVFHYHDQTKHDYYRYAASLGHLDWDNQPDPFRRFIGSRLISLPLTEVHPSLEYDQLYSQKIQAHPVSVETISALFFYSLALSAWKQYQDTSWALRVNPSSGNLHPTEGYLVIDKIKGKCFLPGVYHYTPKEHGLELRTEFGLELWKELTEQLPQGSFLVGLSSIHWREAWKYGERAFRYCQHDIGHAWAALAISASMLGWKLQIINTISDEAIAQLLGLNRFNEFEKEEKETADILAVIIPSNDKLKPGQSLKQEAIQKIANGKWYGKANKLNEEYYPWEIIDMVSDACEEQKSDCDIEKPSTQLFSVTHPVPVNDVKQERKNTLLAGQIIRQRRSAVAMDGVTSITKAQFYEMLSRVIPVVGSMLWDSIAQRPFIHLGLFVHRVVGLIPGLYALVRDPEKLSLLQTSMHAEFQWKTPLECPQSLPLFLLEEKEVQNLAASVSCGQDIAGAGAFSCGMLAEFEEPIRRFGAHWYRRLFWETGMIGQVLYLEAEAKGVQATGIGCFFDNPVHDVFGLTGHAFQSLYHFTIGGSVEDDRLSTLPSYQHLASSSIL